MHYSSVASYVLARLHATPRQAYILDGDAKKGLRGPCCSPPSDSPSDSPCPPPLPGLFFDPDPTAVRGAPEGDRAVAGQAWQVAGNKDETPEQRVSAGMI